jgi:hypothetical protein
LLQHVELGYDLLYLLRGAPVVYYGDEVGMTGTGGDQAARQDMFPTQVQEWQTQERVGSPPIGKGSSFDVVNNPLQAELRQLGALRDANPALGSGWSLVRYAKAGVLVVSRIDPATKQEYLAAFNNGNALVSVPVITATPSTAWLPLNCPAKSSPDQSDAKGRVVITVPSVSGCLYKAQATIPDAAPARPTLKVGRDDLTSMTVASAKVGAPAPVSVAFLVRRPGGTWSRLDVDTSPPYRGFFTRPRTTLQVVAVVRSLDGRTATSKTVTLSRR